MSPSVGEYEYHWNSRQLGLRKVFCLSGNHKFTQSTRRCGDGHGKRTPPQYPYGALTRRKDSFYKTLTPEENAIAHRDDYDFDSPDAIDFDVLVQTLKDLKRGYLIHQHLEIDLFVVRLTVNKDER